MFKNLDIKTEKGLTLVEIIFTILIITIAVVGVYQALTYGMKHTQQAQERFVASYLAKEGIEIVKNIRDTNWIEETTWNEGLINCGSGCEADYNDSSLTSFSGQYFYIDPTNYFYQYNDITGEKTPYQRKITLTNYTDKIDITVDVMWRENIITIKESIYNWK